MGLQFLQVRDRGLLRHLHKMIRQVTMIRRIFFLILMHLLIFYQPCHCSPPYLYPLYSASSVLSTMTEFPFTIITEENTAFCQLHFASDITCIEFAQVTCKLLKKDAPKMGRGTHSETFITKINGAAYDIYVSITVSPDSEALHNLELCPSSTCIGSSSSASSCIDYCIYSSSSSSSFSSSSPIHSEFKYVSSSYLSLSSSSSSSSSSSLSLDGQGLVLIFGSSPGFSSSPCSVANFGWSSGSEGIVQAWSEFSSSSSSETTTETTAQVVTNSQGSVIGVPQGLLTV